MKGGGGIEKDKLLTQFNILYMRSILQQKCHQHYMRTHGSTMFLTSLLGGGFF